MPSSLIYCVSAFTIAASLQEASLVSPPATAVDALSVNSRVITSSERLRQVVREMSNTPNESHSALFRLDLPLVSNGKTDIGALQSPGAWSFQPDTQSIVVDVDFGAITPQNFNAFETDNLYEAPPLRTFYFWTKFSRAQRLSSADNGQGGVSTTKGWYEPTESYGIAVPASAAAHGMSGGDLPDEFTPPFRVNIPLRSMVMGTLVSSLRLRVEGQLRMIAGRSVLCGNYRGGGYSADQGDQQRTPVILDVRACLAPAVLTRVSLVRTDSSRPLKVWMRTERAPTPENAETAVRANRDAPIAPSFIAPKLATSPNSTPRSHLTPER